MPIKNESLDCITGIHAASSSRASQTTGKTNGFSYPYQFSDGSEKVIEEINRILKPGGYFISLEMNMECDYDLQKIYNDYNEHGKLFGIYTYDEIQAVCKLLIEEPWNEKFTAAGFKVEVEKKHLRKYSIDEVKKFLFCYTYFNGIREWTDEERILYSITNNNIKYIQSKHTIDGILKEETLYGKFYLLNSLTKIENSQVRKLSVDEIKDILYKMAGSGEIDKYASIIENRNDGEAEDIGIDLYQVDSFYVLRKPE